MFNLHLSSCFLNLLLFIRSTMYTRDYFHYFVARFKHLNVVSISVSSFLSFRLIDPSDF